MLARAMEKNKREEIDEEKLEEKACRAVKNKEQ
jgi:hypothetical protein